MPNIISDAMIYIICADIVIEKIKKNKPLNSDDLQVIEIILKKFVEEHLENERNFYKNNSNRRNNRPKH